MANPIKNSDTLTDRRQNGYSFSSQKDLVTFFSTVLPKKVILETIKTLKQNFQPREDTSKADNKMQFLKKCEWELVRLTRKSFVRPEKK